MCIYTYNLTWGGLKNGKNGGDPYGFCLIFGVLIIKWFFPRTFKLVTCYSRRFSFWFHLVLFTVHVRPVLSPYQASITFFNITLCHGFVSAGDALGQERPATPMSSFLAGHSGCKWPNTYLLLGRAPLSGAYGWRSLLRSTPTLEGGQCTGARITKWMGG